MTIVTNTFLLRMCATRCAAPVKKFRRIDLRSTEIAGPGDKNADRQLGLSARSTHVSAHVRGLVDSPKDENKADPKEREGGRTSSKRER